MLRQLQRTLLVVAVLGLLLPARAGAATDKELQRQHGSVSYRDPGGVEHRVAGQVVLPDDARAQTGRASMATLTLPDSSVVALGEKTDVVVGAFNAAVTVNNTISVNGGALKFAIHHPQGARSNYTFSTPTSQIAVRGTEGYLIVGPNGTQVVCTQCEPGDVQVTILKTGAVVALLSGQVLNVVNSGGSVNTSQSTTSELNSVAVNQFSNGVNPFANNAPSSDITGSTSGATANASAAGGLAGAGASTIAGAAVAAVAGAVITANNTTQSSSGQSAPLRLTLTPASFNFNGAGQTQTFSASMPITSATSANPSIASVSSFAGTTLTVHAVAVGSTTITVSAGGSSTVLNVTVAGTVVTPQGIH